ncbi:MAG: hypothetical protein K0R08_1846 [Solimicrobium sp.]|nr:hypothetical protein [Solimicrobium sp.]
MPLVCKKRRFNRVEARYIEFDAVTSLKIPSLFKNHSWRNKWNASCERNQMQQLWAAHVESRIRTKEEENKALCQAQGGVNDIFIRQEPSQEQFATINSPIAKNFDTLKSQEMSLEKVTICLIDCVDCVTYGEFEHDDQAE